MSEKFMGVCPGAKLPWFGSSEPWLLLDWAPPIVPTTLVPRRKLESLLCGLPSLWITLLTPRDIIDPKLELWASIELNAPREVYLLLFYCNSSSNFCLANRSRVPSSLTKYARIFLLNFCLPSSSKIGKSYALWRASNKTWAIPLLVKILMKTFVYLLTGYCFISMSISPGFICLSPTLRRMY